MLHICSDFFYDYIVVWVQTTPYTVRHGEQKIIVPKLNYNAQVLYTYNRKGVWGFDFREHIQQHNYKLFVHMHHRFSNSIIHTSSFVFVRRFPFLFWFFFCFFFGCFVRFLIFFFIGFICRISPWRWFFLGRLCSLLRSTLGLSLLCLAFSWLCTWWRCAIPR